ncbi:MAG TPA: Uma2 family endonuclease [Chloroflexi bacterium]|nr:Uma2 family endonuclease [Chloroflexota bacterium]
MTTTRHYTIDDLAAIEEPGRYDLIRGELLKMPPAGGDHSEIGVNLIYLLWGHVRRDEVGRVYGPDAGFLLARDPDVLLSPDAAFVRNDRLPPSGGRQGFLMLAPDVAVEIVSPSDRASAVDAKVAEYLRAGTQLVLVVQPELRSIAVWTPDQRARVYREADEIDFGDVLPGFRLRVSDVFA